MRLVMTVLVMLCLLVPVSAEDAVLYGTADFDTDAILDALPEEVRRTLPEGIFEADGFAERFSADYFFRLIGDAVKAALSPAWSMTATTLGLVLIAAALTALRSVVRADALASLFEFVSGLCILLTVYTRTAELFRLVSLYLTQLSGIVTAMVPVMIAIGTAGGNLSASTVSAGSMMMGLAFVETLAAHGLFPVLQLCFGMTAASGIGGGMKLSGITNLVRGTFTWILGLIAAVISAVMSFQNAIASRADSLSMRAVRFAASKAVPVVGGIASDAVGAVAESLSLVRSVVGTAGIILIAVLTLPVLINVLLSRLGVSVTQTAAEILGLDRERALLSELTGLLGFLAAVCVIAALMFVYALALFAKTAAAMGG